MIWVLSLLVALASAQANTGEGVTDLIKADQVFVSGGSKFVTKCGVSPNVGDIALVLEKSVAVDIATCAKRCNDNARCKGMMYRGDQAPPAARRLCWTLARDPTVAGRFQARDCSFTFAAKKEQWVAPEPQPEAECEKGETDDSNPCTKKQCANGKWVTAHVDCAKDMGAPCNGEWIPAEEGKCCETCRPKMCCKAMTADCMSCAKGQTKEEYCKENPRMQGCPRVCCKAMTADCLSCSG